jgi:3-oxoacyl-[acyl-carrier protein] reductase
MQDEIALITGASRGIGRAIATELGRRGATVIGTATRPNGAEAIGEYLAAEGIKGQGMALNVTEPESIDRVIKTINNDYGAVTVLVNNAGIPLDNILMRMKEAEWDEIIDTNLSSIYRMSKACLKGMTRARRGRIVNISSVVGASGNPGQANYAAAKAGIVGFSKSLAQEIGSRNITVNTVAPGFIDTDMTRELDEDQRAALESKIPLNRLGAAEDVAHAVAFLASAEAGYITGVTLHVNGGLYMS